MEVVRNIEPDNDFLNKVKKLSNSKGIVLIFDECTTGFRETFGGIHKKFEIEPDMIILGKTLGNGYAITAILGKREIMNYAQKTFISSTFWTERIGPTAALKTLEIMKKTKSWEIITDIGLIVRKTWNELAEIYDLNIKISGIPSLSKFEFCSDIAIKSKTFMTQEMLKNGFLSTTSFYPSIAHKKIHIQKYADFLSTVFKKISEFERGIENIDDFLEGPECHKGFRRLN